MPEIRTCDLENFGKPKNMSKSCTYRSRLVDWLKKIGKPTTLLHEIFATCQFRDFEARIFRDTQFSRFFENFVF